MAGKSTLNRLELSKLEPTRYHKISHNPVAIKELFVDLFLEAHERAPNADHPRSRCDRRSAARRAGGAVLPRLLRLLLLSAALRVLRPPSVGRQAAARRTSTRRPARSRRWRASSPTSARRWPRVRILLRADSGFAREELMAWCEANGVRLPVRPGEERAARSPRSRPNLSRPRRRAGAPASRRGASRTSCGRRGRAGAARAGSWPRPNGPKARPIRASSSPR